MTSHTLIFRLVHVLILQLGVQQQQTFCTHLANFRVKVASLSLKVRAVLIDARDAHTPPSQLGKIQG